MGNPVVSRIVSDDDGSRTVKQDLESKKRPVSFYTISHQFKHFRKTSGLASRDDSNDVSSKPACMERLFRFTNVRLAK